MSCLQPLGGGLDGPAGRNGSGAESQAGLRPQTRQMPSGCQSIHTQDEQVIVLNYTNTDPSLAPDVIAIVGNPRRNSRTLKLAGGIADGLATHFGDRPAVVIDLVDLDVGTAGFTPDLNQLVASAQVVIAASPTVMGSYAGLLKLFFDSLPEAALDGKLGIPLMIARQARHAMAADVHLRPALLELGATCSTPSLVALESELASLGTDGLVTAWLERSSSWLAGIPVAR
jgi:FMN reductase